MKRIIAGPRAVTEALYGRAGNIAVIYFTEGYAVKKNLRQIEKLADEKRVFYQERDRTYLDKLAEHQRHQDVVAVAGDYCYFELSRLLAQESSRPLLLALDQVTDPHNFGAIVRSAVAFAVDGIVTLKDRASPVSHTVVRASAGATEHAKIARATNLARTLKLLSKSGMQIVGLDAQGMEELSALPFPTAGRVLVVGSEGRGLRRLTKESCDVLARISLAGPIASLNASIATAIALYESDRLRHKRIDG